MEQKQINWCVYQYYNTINGKIYIGKTNNFDKRSKNHANISHGGKLKYSIHYQAIHAAINKYGAKIEYCIIQNLSSKLEADECEKYWIKFFKSNNPKYGYNLTAGGEGTEGRKHSIDTKLKMRIAKLGKKVSEETKLKMSKSKFGKKLSDQHKEKISKSSIGRKLSKEHAEALLKANLGVEKKEETKNRISAALFNKHMNGEKNNNSSISNEDAQKIRALYATKQYTQTELGNMFNIDQTTVSLIVRWKSYKMVNNCV
jgi:group I intron endonuclease